MTTLRPAHPLVLIVSVSCVTLLAPEAMAGTVTGVVRQAGGSEEPIANARVTLFEPALTFFREARTDVAGAFTVEDIPPGPYRLGASALRFEYFEAAVVVEEGALVFDISLGPETETGYWEVVGNTLPEFLDGTDIGILRPDGTIFYCHDTMDPLVFDPATGEKSFPAGSPTAQGCMNGTVLEDGRILMAGGNEGGPANYRDAVPWVKTYTPQSDSWQLLADMQLAAGRYYPGLARLSDGSLLVMGGGMRPDAMRTETCERFDLATQTWNFTGSMVNPTDFPPCALLYTGEVLATWWPPQLYNPTTERWRLTGNFNQPNRLWPGHSDHSIVVLEDGRVVAIGIREGPDGNTAMGEIYDPATETWSLTSNPGLVRLQAEVVQLPDGRILVAGGETQVHSPPVEDVQGIVKWCDLYDPSIDTWRRVADLNWFREFHAVTLLVPDGRVVTTGGTSIGEQGPMSADIEAFVPPYLLRGVRPVITEVSNTTPARGEEISLHISPDTGITSVVLMGTGATTHWVDAGIPRRLVLRAAQNDSTVVTTLPTDPNVLPLGHYMLFAMVDDIPSEAVIVQVVEAADVIPTVSEWGMIVMVLLMLAAGTIVVHRPVTAT